MDETTADEATAISAGVTAYAVLWADWGYEKTIFTPVGFALFPLRWLWWSWPSSDWKQIRNWVKAKKEGFWSVPRRVDPSSPVGSGGKP